MPSNRLVPQIKLSLTSCQNPLINYLEMDCKYLARVIFLSCLHVFSMHDGSEALNCQKWFCKLCICCYQILLPNVFLKRNKNQSFWFLTEGCIILAGFWVPGSSSRLEKYNDCKTKRNNHSWAKFKIVLVRKLERKFYYFMAKFEGSGFSFQSLNQNLKVLVFPSIFWIQNFKVVVFSSNLWIKISR